MCIYLYPHLPRGARETIGFCPLEINDSGVLKRFQILYFKQILAKHEITSYLLITGLFILIRPTTH